MKIIKLGGSLLSTRALKECLNKIADFDVATVIVPGGGVFADQVRLAQVEWGLDDRTAHVMAILAMQQMALLMRSLQPSFAIHDNIDAFDGMDKTAIWSPAIHELDRAGIPASWAITSDSMAAWLASRIQANELIVIKSCAIPANASIPQLQQLGILDAGFLQFNEATTFKTSIINKDHFLLPA